MRNEILKAYGTLTRKERGVTMVELLVALFIISVVIAAAASFYEYYSYHAGRIGDSDTARNLAVSALEMQIDQTKWGDTRTGEVYKKTYYFNATKFEVIVTRTNKTDTVNYYNNHIQFFLVTAKVFYNGKHVEVNGYVTAQ